MLEAARSYSNCSNKIKMLKNATACRIKSFISIEVVNVEKLRLTKVSLANCVLNEFNKVHFLNIHVANTNAFYIMIFAIF